MNDFDFEIINIKLSAKLTKSLTFDEIEAKFPFLSSHAGFGRIIFRHEDYTFCIMGRLNDFLNITGVKSLQHVRKSIKCFQAIFPSQKIIFQSLRFDSICAVYVASAKIIKEVLSPNCTIFWIKRYPNIFSRINVKPKYQLGVSVGMSANIFQSGKCVIFGARNIDDLCKFISLLKNPLTLT